MNTPKEEAEDLVNRYTLILFESGFRVSKPMVIKCALIAVNRILNVLWHSHKNEEKWRYHLEVKQEIKKL